MITITGASGQLGRLVIDALLKTVEPARIVAAVRTPEKVQDLAARGVVVRRADYDAPDTLAAALAGTERLLLISSSEVGQRARQHKAVIDAAVKAGVGFVAYTSILHADTSPLGLAEEHRQTEAMLKASGLPFALLRNGWYTENFALRIPAALEYGVLAGAAGDGRIASAARADYAAAAAAVLTREGQAGLVYELAGDSAFTLTDLAAVIARQSGKSVAYSNMPEVEYRGLLEGAGLPGWLAAMLADSDAGMARGGLFDEGGQLGALIGRPSTPMAETVRAAL